MTEDDGRLSHALLDLADHQVTTGPVPVADLLRRGRRARRLRALTGTAAATGAALLALTVGVAAAPAGPAGPLAPAVTATPAPASHQGYRVTLTYTVESGRVAPDHQPPGGHADRYSGTVDPGSHRAQLDGPQRFRFTDGEEYVEQAGTWHAGTVVSAPRGTLPVGQLLTDDPQELLTRLRALGTVTRSGGGGAQESYTFSYLSTTSPYTGEPAELTGHVPNAVVGSVELSGGRYRSITLQTTLTGPDPASADREPVTRRMVIVFADAGAPVTVERPTPPPA
ncbi:hypothetical protein AB0K43_04420 [Kitasatospora sp. NPDC049258]|uniref:hypothetical protein n=1 Tax=Kitasatospora sp. NPDC049258 TaxID=3155394 RepID=UPI003413A05B